MQFVSCESAVSPGLLRIHVGLISLFLLGSLSGRRNPCEGSGGKEKGASFGEKKSWDMKAPQVPAFCIRECLSMTYTVDCNMKRGLLSHVSYYFACIKHVFMCTFQPIDDEKAQSTSLQRKFPALAKMF